MKLTLEVQSLLLKLVLEEKHVIRVFRNSNFILYIIRFINNVFFAQHSVPESPKSRQNYYFKNWSINFDHFYHEIFFLDL